MRRLLLTAATLATIALPSTGADAAFRYCYNGGGGCVYDDNGYWCWWERGPNGNTREICVGATGVRTCTYTFPDTQERCTRSPIL